MSDSESILSDASTSYDSDDETYIHLLPEDGRPLPYLAPELINLVSFFRDLLQFL
jgi:hypothetical protein